MSSASSAPAARDEACAAAADPELDPARLAAFDDVIDVRSPSEYAADHLPGAINLPVLNDAERARVGEIYVQVSKFDARRIGAALVSANLARHIEGPLADKPGGWRPLIYCWRGGMRSGAATLVLSQIGWRARQLEGGYKRFRRRVLGDLYERPCPARLVLIEGGTGAGKSAILTALAARGAQVVDLEALAEHRGSLFGDVDGAAQPSQKLFETRLWRALISADPARPVVLEAEASKIGARALPPTLWRAMRRAPRIEISAAPELRAKRLAADYAGLLARPEALGARLDALIPRHGRERVAAWRALAEAGAAEPLAAALIETHYDPLYAHARRRSAAPILARAALEGAGPEEIERAAERVAAALERA